MTELGGKSSKRLHLPQWMCDGPPGSPYRMINGLGFIVVMVTLLVVVGVAIATPALLIDRRNCGYAARQYERPTRWDLFAGCYVRTDSGAYIGLDKYLAIAGLRAPARPAGG